MYNTGVRVVPSADCDAEPPLGIMGGGAEAAAPRTRTHP
eukprot:SAG22_NODE_3385_length_1742_cov_1.671942_1_plen_39_part_00